MARHCLGSGLSELRNVLSSPGDQLYRQLTDLIHALDESGDVDERNGDKNDSRVENPKKNVSSLLASSSRIGTCDGTAARSNMMDTSSTPMRKKVRRRKRRRRSATLPESSYAAVVSGRGIGGANSLSQPSAIEFCVSHSPLNYSSDSSVDKAAVQTSVQTVTMGVSDSDLDRLLQRSTAAATNSNGTRMTNGGADMGQFRAIRERLVGAYPDAASLLPLWTQGPIESDSFTETMTPSRYHHQRRKRLIKRMAVDPPNGEMGLFGQQNVAMDVDMSPRFPRAFTARKHAASYSENSVDCDACSFLSGSDTDDGHVSSDPGRQGDDELSDWYHDLNGPGGEQAGDEYMGVPELKEAVRLAAAKTMNMESSDTDMSQSSFSQPTKRILSRNAAFLCGALNRRIVQFLKDQTETELSLGELRKRERKEALRLAIFYHLDVRREGSVGTRCYVLCKTKYSQWPD